MSRGFTEGDDRAVIAGRRGGIVRGKQLAADRLKLWAEKYPEVSPEAASEIFRQGYVAGHQAKRQAQRRSG